MGRVQGRAAPWVGRASCRAVCLGQSAGGITGTQASRPDPGDRTALTPAPAQQANPQRHSEGGGGLPWDCGVTTPMHAQKHLQCAVTITPRFPPLTCSTSFYMCLALHGTSSGRDRTPAPTPWRRHENQFRHLQGLDLTWAAGIARMSL